MTAQYEQAQDGGATLGTEQSVEYANGGRMQSGFSSANEQPWDQHTDEGLCSACERGHDAPNRDPHRQDSGGIEAICQRSHDWAAQRIHGDEGKARDKPELLSRQSQICADLSAEGWQKHAINVAQHVD